MAKSLITSTWARARIAWRARSSYSQTKNFARRCNQKETIPFKF